VKKGRSGKRLTPGRGAQRTTEPNETSGEHTATRSTSRTPTTSRISSTGSFTGSKAVPVRYASGQQGPSVNYRLTTTTRVVKGRLVVVDVYEAYYAPLATDSWRT
jgi:hypothetical protein